jgi:hypothetical protein
MAKYIVCTLTTFQFDGSSTEVANVFQKDRRVHPLHEDPMVHRIFHHVAC